MCYADGRSLAENYSCLWDKFSYNLLRNWKMKGKIEKWTILDSAKSDLEKNDCDSKPRLKSFILLIVYLVHKTFLHICLRWLPTFNSHFVRTQSMSNTTGLGMALSC